MTKLTLSVDEAIVEKAKRHAEANGTSVSAMFSQFVQSLTNGQRAKIRPGRLTRQASGLVRMPADADEKDVLADALIEKYAADQ